MTITAPGAGDIVDDWFDDITDAVNALSDPWVAYTPAWTATSDPTNGILSGKYRRGSGLVFVTARMLADGYTTFGSGDWRLSLPVAAKDGTLHTGSALAYDSSSGAGSRPLVCWLGSSTTLRFTGSSGEVNATSPFVWASGDQLRVSFIYEPA